MESISLNVLTKILSYLTAPDIVMFSITNHHIVETFDSNFVLWDLALKSQPIGYAQSSPNNKGKFPINVCRDNCILALRIHNSCRCTSSIGLLLSTLTLYPDCQELCFDIYQHVLKLSANIAIDDHKTKLLVYEAFVKEFTLYNTSYPRICKAMDVYKTLITNYQTKRNSSEGHHFQSSIAVASNNVIEWVSEVPDTVHNRNDDRMCEILVQIIRKCVNRRIKPQAGLRLASTSSFALNLLYQESAAVESSSQTSQANLDVLNTAISICVNLSIFPVQSAAMIRMNLSTTIRNLLSDMATVTVSDINCIPTKIMEHAMYLLINLTDKRNIDSISLQEMCKVACLCVDDVFRAYARNQPNEFVQFVKKVVDFLLVIFVWYEDAILDILGVSRCIERIYALVCDFDHAFHVGSSSSIDNDNIACKIEMLKARALSLTKSVLAIAH